MPTKPKHKPRGVLRQNDSAFVDADPIVYVTRSVHAEIGKPSYSQIARDSGLAYATVKNLLEGDTRRPQHHTVMVLMDRAFGYSETWRRKGFTDRVVKPSPKLPKKAKE